MTAVNLESSLTCPACGHAKVETMPTDACQWFYECEQCHVVLQPKPGDCCVYCSYGTVPCPPVMRAPLPLRSATLPSNMLMLPTKPATKREAGAS